MFSDAIFRIRALLRRRTVESELDEELRFHLDQQVEKNLRAGMSREEAMRQARLSVGGMDQVKEECREARGVRVIETLFQDARYALRMLRKNPVFTLVAILTLALGVGANTAIFSIVNGVLLRSLPFPEPQRLVRIFFADPGKGMPSLLYSLPELEDLRNRAGVFEAVTGLARGSIDLTGGGKPERLEMIVANANYFSMLGVSPQIGRLFGPQDYLPGFAPSVVVSDDFWRREFGGDPRVLGQTIRLDIDAYQIVGVLPPGFRNPGRTGAHDVDVWVATGFASAADPKPLRSNRSFPGSIGRLKRGISLEQAQARLTAMAAEIRRDYPGDYPTPSGWTVQIRPLQEDVVGKVRPTLMILLGAVSVIVLIVALNIANLLLARASRRQQEMAVRSALGAGRGRIVSQMLTESVLLSALGGAAGIAAAYATLGAIVRLIPSSVPRLSEVRIDWVVMLAAFGVSLIAGVLFGLAPALDLSRIAAGLRQGGRTGTSAAAGRLRDGLIISELALAVVLMVGAGLLLRTLDDLLKQDPGFDPSGIVTASVNLPFPNDPKDDPYATMAQQIRFYRELEQRVQRIPGVERVGLVSHLPASETSFHFTLGIAGRSALENLRAQEILANPGYFQTMGVGLVRGRYFAETDEDGKQRAAIVDESTARRYWQDGDALGKRIRMGAGAWMTIVGVVKDVRQGGLDVAGDSHVYVPMYQEFDVSPGYVFRDFVIVARSSLGASALEPEIRRAVAGADPELPVYNVALMSDLLGRSLATRTFSTELVGGFAATALLLASIGIYGLLAYLVGQRTREIGVRMALGASRSDIVRPIVAKGFLLAAIGIGAGLAVSASAASAIAGLLYGVKPHDPAVFLVVPALLLAVAGLASYLPARRATKVDPLSALREA
jgi:predicted permease